MVALKEQPAPNASPRRIACLSVDMEPDLRCPDMRIRLLEDDARRTALTSLLRTEAVPLTSFTVMAHARRYIDQLNALAREVDLEFAIHSYSHDTDNPASAEEVRRAVEAFGELWNDKPQGYRAPNCLIDERGIANLLDAGFVYDSSIVPSMRPDRYSYNNMHFGRMPFRFSGEGGTLLELPIACLRAVRMPLILSYVKLLGLGAYRAAMELFPLPDVVVTYFHPYDLYIDEIAQYTSGWKQHAHRRNSRNAMRLLAQVIALLKARGYVFMTMRDLAAEWSRRPLVDRTLRSA